MKRLNYLVINVTILLLMASCEQKLSDKEREIISIELPKELYMREIEVVDYQLGDYLKDAIDDYEKSLRKKLQKKIDERNATNALLGGSMFDFSELFGPSANEIIAEQYNDYINYVNRNINDVENLAIGMTKILAQHPDFIEKFNNEEQETISLEIFKDLDKVPNSISGNSMDLGMITLDDTDKLNWGEILMGDYKKPHISIPAILYASILAVEHIQKPKPVYAIYNDDDESWDIGYNSEEALKVYFETKVDLIKYQFEPTRYESAFIKSKLNMLNQK